MLNYFIIWPHTNLIESTVKWCFFLWTHPWNLPMRSTTSIQRTIEHVIPLQVKIALGSNVHHVATTISSYPQDLDVTWIRQPIWWKKKGNFKFYQMCVGSPIMIGFSLKWSGGWDRMKVAVTCIFYLSILYCFCWKNSTEQTFPSGA